MTDAVSAELKDFILLKARALCEKEDASLVYLSLVGSSLFGSRVPGKSDVDVRGLFLPSVKSLTLGNAAQSVQYATRGAERRNSPEDVDIDLWSLQYWLLKLLPAGDTGAMDLLFSPSHNACTLYRHPMLDKIFAAPLRLVDTERGSGYAEYSLRQAKKYGVKGSILKVLRTVSVFLHERHADSEECLSSYFDALVKVCGEDRFCSVREVDGRQMLSLFGKLHEGTTRMYEFMRRVDAGIARYGERTQEAEIHGADFKALSHALRALMQMEELLTTGKIKFPLQGRGELAAIKEGRVARDEVEARIVTSLETVNALRKTLHRASSDRLASGCAASDRAASDRAAAPFRGTFDREFAESSLLSCYASRPSASPHTLDKKSARFAEGFQIPSDTLEAIQSKLSGAEAKHGVRILCACESGSRGWNFASQDSDYDVRFIYVHDPDWYMSAAPEERPDTLDLGLENTLAGELDINGWDLRKALKLFRRSNGPLLERLSSPLIYHETGSTMNRLRELAPSYFSPLALWHHYRGLMETSRSRCQTGSPAIKTWFYMLRALLCMRWIELGRGIPPMRFDLLMELLPDADIKAEIQNLVERKRRGIEGARFTPPPSVTEYADTLVKTAAEAPAARPPHRAESNLENNLDVIFREAVMLR